MNYAYFSGRLAALIKFGAASAAAPADSSSVRDSGSPVATTTHRNSAQNVAQAFAANAALGQTSSFPDPGFQNAILQGGTPTKPFPTDTTGGLT